MNPLLVQGILTGVRAILTWFNTRKEGNRAGAVEVLRSVDLRPFGLDQDELELVNYAKAGLAFITRRGIAIEEAIALLELAESEDRDVTEEEVQAMLDVLDSEMDETQEMIDEVRAQEEEQQD